MKVTISTLEQNKDDVTDIVYKSDYFLKNSLINDRNTQLKSPKVETINTGTFST